MEDMGLVKREVLSAKPFAVPYEITDFGRTALDVLNNLKVWAEKHGI
jgi:DNA-binding HxlR family transcriptional regulator